MRKVLHILGTLDDTDMKWLLDRGKIIRPPQGTLLIAEGSKLDLFLIVLQGELDVCIGPTGTIIATLRTGEVIGEMSFVSSDPPSASVIARTGAAVLAIPRQELFAQIHADSQFGMRFYKAIAIFLADRLRVTVGRLGYGMPSQDSDSYRLADDDMMDIDNACTRFDMLLRSCLGATPN